MTDTTPTPEAVERCYFWNEEYACSEWVRASDHDARVDALTKERDTERTGKDMMGNLWAKAKEERDAARAASGAVAEAMREKAAKVCANTGVSWAKAEVIRAIPIPPDAAAALAEDRKRVRRQAFYAGFDAGEEVTASWERGAGTADTKETTFADFEAAILARKEDANHDHC